MKFGKDGQTKNIHQALWATGITSLEEASNYSNQLVFRELEEMNIDRPQILDLGCGVGSSVFYIANHSAKANLTGISISPTQIQLANQQRKKLEFEDRCTFKEADFQQLPSLEPVDMAYAIEAFVHSPNPSGFFEQVSKKLKSGGKLVLIDDFRSSRIKISKTHQQNIQDFQEGWIAGGLITVGEAAALAKKVGLTLSKEQHLTPLMRIGRPRDKLFGILIFFFRKWMKKSTYFKMIVGGYAKQQCLKQNIINYNLLVFLKE